MLLYIKKIFHLEVYYSLDGDRGSAANVKAFDLYSQNFEAFVDRCIDAVEKSIEARFNDEKTELNLCEANSATDAIKAKVENFTDEGDDLRVKEQLKNYVK